MISDFDIMYIAAKQGNYPLVDIEAARYAERRKRCELKKCLVGMTLWLVALFALCLVCN